MNIIEKTRKECNRDLDLGLALSKAEGNLNFLAGESSKEDWKSSSRASITQGMAILETLNAVQEARKAWQEIISEKHKKSL